MVPLVASKLVVVRFVNTAESALKIVAKKLVVVAFVIDALDEKRLVAVAFPSVESPVTARLVDVAFVIVALEDVRLVNAAVRAFKADVKILVEVELVIVALLEKSPFIIFAQPILDEETV